MASAYYSLLTILKQSDFIFPFSKVKICFLLRDFRLIFFPCFHERVPHGWLLEILKYCPTIFSFWHSVHNRSMFWPPETKCWCDQQSVPEVMLYNTPVLVLSCHVKSPTILRLPCCEEAKKHRIHSCIKVSSGGLQVIPTQVP